MWGASQLLLLVGIMNNGAFSKKAGTMRARPEKYGEREGSGKGEGRKEGEKVEENRN